MSHPDPTRDPENELPYDPNIVGDEELTDMFGEGGKEEVAEAFRPLPKPEKHIHIWGQLWVNGAEKMECTECGEVRP